MKKIIVFGGNGNTGKYVVEYLNEHLKEYKIIVVGRKTIKDKNSNYIQMDIIKKLDFKKLPNENVFAVVNLAGAMPAQTQDENPYIYVNTNIIGTLNILEYCRKCNVDRVIYPQTEADLKGYWDKEEILKPSFNRKYELKGNYGIYILSKCTAVDLITYYHNEYNLKAFILRLPTIYLYKRNPYYYVNGERKMLGYRQLISNAMNGIDIELWGDPNRKKDIVYVKDYCQLIYKVLICNKDYGIYNVGTGKGVTLQEQIDGIIEVFSKKNNRSKIIYLNDKPNARQFIMDISNARKDLGYEPMYSYLDYLKDFKIEMEKDLSKNTDNI